MLARRRAGEADDGFYLVYKLPSALPFRPPITHTGISSWNTRFRNVSAFNTSPNAAEGLGYCRAGIWMSGGAPSADAAGNLYVITGNGIFDGTSAFGDTFLKPSVRWSGRVRPET